MSAEWETDDLARMMALEHAFGALSLMWSYQFAKTSGSKPSETTLQFRNAVLSSIYDSGDYPSNVREKIKKHLERMLDNLSKMSKLADRDFDD